MVDLVAGYSTMEGTATCFTECVALSLSPARVCGCVCVCESACPRADGQAQRAWLRGAHSLATCSRSSPLLLLDHGSRTTALGWAMLKGREAVAAIGCSCLVVVLGCSCVPRGCTSFASGSPRTFQRRWDDDKVIGSRTSPGKDGATLGTQRKRWFRRRREATMDGGGGEGDLSWSCCI